MKMSLITRAQWVSVIKNALIAGAAAFVAALQINPNADKAVLIAALSAAVAAAVKVIEKAFTEA